MYSLLFQAQGSSPPIEFISDEVKPHSDPEWTIHDASQQRGEFAMRAG